MNSSFYSSSIKDLVDQSPETILGHLAKQNSFSLEALQRNAWLAQISILQRELRDLESGWIAFEFAIPRMGKRADNIVLVGGLIFVLEFKVGTEQFDNAALDQVVDYALDLKNFHGGSHDRPIVPIVVATGALDTVHSLIWADDKVAQPVLSNGAGLGALIKDISNQATIGAKIDVQAWLSSGYKPTPTIIEAAQALYQGHKVDEITRSDAGAINLSQTAECIAQIIEDAKSNRHKAICFVTGVPGAGKTLAGLNLVTQRTNAHEEEHAVFLSGNGPLVDVLREALARDEHAQLGSAVKICRLEGVYVAPVGSP
jgi:schlafen family protein